jgi:hypothetical protein
MKNKLFIIPVFVFLTALILSPQTTLAYRNCGGLAFDCDGNGSPDCWVTSGYQLHAHWWQSCSGAACRACAGGSKTTSGSGVQTNNTNVPATTVSARLGGANSDLPDLISSFPSSFAALKSGSTGTLVEPVAGILNNLGFISLAPGKNGDIAVPTSINSTIVDGINNFQQFFGLAQNGAVGPTDIATVQAFSNNLNKAVSTLPAGVSSFVVKAAGSSVYGQVKAFDPVSGNFSAVPVVSGIGSGSSNNGSGGYGTAPCGTGSAAGYPNTCGERCCTRGTGDCTGAVCNGGGCGGCSAYHN